LSILYLRCITPNSSSLPEIGNHCRTHKQACGPCIRAAWCNSLLQDSQAWLLQRCCKHKHLF
jgi:hypothetical protein